MVSTQAAVGGTGADEAPAVRDRPRRTVDRVRFWRSPPGQPWWSRPALLAIAAGAAVLFAWRITDNGLAPYYSAAVRSMSVSWRAFAFGALDPGATVTIDKLAGSFLPQALAVRVLGYHGWVLALPQVIEGVVAVLVMYRVGRRWLGPVAGLLAAALFALTPVVASMFGHPMEDGLLTLALVLAADSLQHALGTGRPGPLLWAGFWVGVGFQAKMMQAWIVLPALALAYLLYAPGPAGRRLSRLAASGAVMLAVSVSWLLLFTAVPAGSRPYVDGSDNDNAFAMAFGYNGLGRIGIDLPGAVPAPRNAPPEEVDDTSADDAASDDTASDDGGADDAAGDADLAPGFGPGGARQPWTKLVEPGYGSQIGWLFPLALIGLGLGMARPAGATRAVPATPDPATPDPAAPDPAAPRQGEPRRGDPGRGGFVLWGVWLATSAAVLSSVRLPHTAYLASLAAPVAALSAGGIVLAWRAHRDGGPLRWAFPVAVVVELAWTVRLARSYPGFLPWLTWVAVAVAAGSVAVLVTAGRGGPPRTPGTRRAARAAAVAGVAAMIAGPAAWSASVLHPKYHGTAFDASAGPVQPMFDIGNLFRTGAEAGPFTSVETVDQLPPSSRRLVEYLVAHRDGARYVAATDGGFNSGPLIGATGLPFLPMGGFIGSTPHPTLEQVQRLVATGQLRFLVLDPVTEDGPSPEPVTSDTVTGPGPLLTVPSVVAWAKGACTDVTDAVGGPGGATTGGDPGAETIEEQPDASLRVLRCGPGG